MEISASKAGIQPFYVLIAAAGDGTRLRAEKPKQYIKVAGKTVLRHTIDAFLSCPGLASLAVIISPSRNDLYLESVEGLSLPPPVLGGKSRKESVYSGLQSLYRLQEDDIVLIHDAARPFIRHEDILSVVTALSNGSRAATLFNPVTDTLINLDGAPTDRSGLRSLQTPQGFHYGLILKAHETVHENCTDDTSLVAALGESVAYVEGKRTNIKITLPEDLQMAEKILTTQKSFRTGFGFDVHAFMEGSSIRLCGVDIPFHKKLMGHSDADVGLHALTDALLGAVAAGDIGQIFPPSDPQWKGADSTIFLKKALSIIQDKNGEIVNIDLTLICEEPKIGPYRIAMQKRIAEICNIQPDQVGIKATTTEGLGFTGRREGIAAQAVATIAF